MVSFRKCQRKHSMPAQSTWLAASRAKIGIASIEEEASIHQFIHSFSPSFIHSANIIIIIHYFPPLLREFISSFANANCLCHNSFVKYSTYFLFYSLIKLFIKWLMFLYLFKSAEERRREFKLNSNWMRRGHFVCLKGKSKEEWLIEFCIF